MSSEFAMWQTEVDSQQRGFQKSSLCSSDIFHNPVKYLDCLFTLLTLKHSKYVSLKIKKKTHSKKVKYPIRYHDFHKRLWLPVHCPSKRLKGENTWTWLSRLETPFYQSRAWQMMAEELKRKSAQHLMALHVLHTFSSRDPHSNQCQGRNWGSGVWYL